MNEHRCDNQHWIPLTKRYKKKFWDSMNFIGKFENLEADTRAMLEKIGAWKKFGATGWGVNGTSPIFHRDLPPDDELKNKALLSQEGRGHQTNAQGNLVGYYAFRPEQLRLVTQYYQDDYALDLMGYVPPDFLELNLTGIEKMFGCF